MLYLVVPVHNRALVTAGFLEALKHQSETGYTLVLVDDGCTDDTVARARAALPPDQLVVLTGDGQLWWAGALQLAYEYLRDAHLHDDDAVLIINDDVQFETDFLRQGLAVLQNHPTSCIQARGIDKASGHQDIGAVANARRLTFRAALPGEEPNCLSTRGLLMRATTFVTSGGFRPRWLPHYLSDYEFTMRMARLGFPLMTASAFTLVADHSTTGEQTFTGSGWRTYIHHSLSNRAMYNPKHWSALAVMIAPPWAVPFLIARIWAGFLMRGLKVAVRHRSPHSAH